MDSIHVRGHNNYTCACTVYMVRHVERNAGGIQHREVEVKLAQGITYCGGVWHTKVVSDTLTSGECGRTG